MNTRLLNILRWCLFAVALFLGVASADENKISILQNPGFKHLVANLQALVQSKAEVKTNHFFISKYLPTKTLTYMFWREGKIIWILELGGDNPTHWEQVIQLPQSGTQIDLDNDVVPTREAVGSSTYLVDQAWVNEIVYDSVINGDLVIIEKKTDSEGNTPH